jgi:ubiquinone/menaquinone biosynthesis C-methylase UbiE
MSSTPDRWATWLRERRHGSDEQARLDALERLAHVRDRVLANGDVGEGDVVLDVGCGDGLIGLGALDLGAEAIFSDVSQDLLDDCKRVAGNRARYLLGSADALPIDDASVDVVTTRSVLIYLDVEGKRRAFREFHRVLRAGGRVSVFEPINRFGHPDPEGRFFGYDLSAVRDLAELVLAAASPEAEQTLVDFDERDLLSFAEEAGFDEIRLAYEARIERGSWLSGSWETVLRTAGNPLAPTIEEAITEALTAEERERFIAHLRPAVEANEGRRRMATAYLRAVKP